MNTDETIMELKYKIETLTAKIDLIKKAKDEEEERMAR